MVPNNVEVPARAVHDSSMHDSPPHEALYEPRDRGDWMPANLSAYHGGGRYGLCGARTACLGPEAYEHIESARRKGRRV